MEVAENKYRDALNFRLPMRRYKVNYFTFGSGEIFHFGQNT